MTPTAKPVWAHTQGQPAVRSFAEQARAGVFSYGSSVLGAHVFGGVTPEGDQLILMAQGSGPEVRFAAEQLNALTPKFTRSDPPGALLCPLSWPIVVQVANTYPGRWHPTPQLAAWLREEGERRFSPMTGGLSAYSGSRVPYPHQVSGALGIARHGRALLWDDPGTGKTMSAVLGLLERAAAGHEVLPIVVVCPRSVLRGWAEEFTRCAPGWRVKLWHGEGRRELAHTADVYVTTYGTLIRDAAAQNDRRPGYSQALLKLKPTSLVLDEFHLTKNAAAKQSRAATRLGRKVAQFIGLSGTPITHHPADQWPALDLLEPGAWPSLERWRARYCLVVVGEREEVIGLHPGTANEYREVLLGRTRRVAKQDVLKDLPPKIYSVRKIEMPDRYRKIYREMANQMLTEVDDGSELSVMDAIVLVNRLSALACAAGEVELVPKLDAAGAPVINELTGEPMTTQRLHLRNPSWKVDTLLEILDERPGRQTLAFTDSRELANLAIESAGKAGHRVGCVLGGQSKGQRDANIAAFQAGERDLMVLTLKAGGVGITLTAADTVVFLQRPYSIVESIQAEDRAHRIGSERHESIEIIDVRSIGTVDVEIPHVLADKAGQLSDVVGDPRILRQLFGGSPAGGADES